MKDRWFFLLQGLLKFFPTQLGIFLRRKIYAPFFVSFGKKITVHDNVKFSYPSHIAIGDNVTFNQGCILVGKGGLTIGSDVAIGADSKIITTTHVFDNPYVPIINQGLSHSPVSIGSDVWFGFNTVVTGGTEIGDGCVVGALTLVNKSFSSRSVIAGIPAKKIGQRGQSNT